MSAAEAGQLLQYQSSTSPNGTVVDYWPGPEPRRHYRVNGAECPSVTSVLDILHKPALTWWGMQVGVEGVLELIRLGEIGKLNGEPVHVYSSADGDGGGYVAATQESVVPLLTQHKITVNHQRDKAGNRGNSVHKALENWIALRIVPDPGMYPEEERGYIEGLLSFLTDLRVPEDEQVESEVMVGSAKHGFAGRFDMRCVINSCELVTNAKKNERKEFRRSRILWDLKTAKRTYGTHHLQLAAYELASKECGYPATNMQCVVRVGSDGTYEVTRNTLTGRDFLAIRKAYDVAKALK